MKYRCPQCKSISSEQAIDQMGMSRWTTSYTGINKEHMTKMDKAHLPYICPMCKDNFDHREWAPINDTLPEELFTI